MNETKLKRMVSRNVAISLGLTCIVLIALIGYFTVTGISAENSYNNLQNQNSNLQRILDLNESMVIVNNETFDVSGGLQTIPPFSIVRSFNFIAPYSGYALVTIHNSTVNPTDIEIKYDNPAGYGFQDLSVPIHTGESSVFPILAITANSSVQFTMGFYNSLTYFNSATITLIYYY